MRRRSLLTVSAAAVGGFLAGCLGDEIEEGETIEVRGTEVPLLSTQRAFDWYDAGELLVLDARSESEWEQLRIADAELSPHPDGLDRDDPTEAVEADTRIMTYCVCPHTLAGSRAATLIDEGFDSVYALDEGLQDWVEKGHPIEGTGVNDSVENVEVPEPEYH